MSQFLFALLLSVVPFSANALSPFSLEDKVMEAFFELEDVGTYFFGDDGEDCFYDYQILSWTESGLVINVTFEIYHQQKWGCYVHQSVICEGRYDQATEKALSGSCEVN